MITFNEFCIHHLDKLYEPRLSYEKQCTGYKTLRYMVDETVKRKKVSVGFKC